MGNWMFEGSADRAFSTWDVDNATRGGVNFQVNSAGACTALRFWRDGPGRSNPTAIALYDATLPDALAVVSPPNDDGSTGWQVTPLPTAVVLTVGHRYFCAVHWGTGGGHGVFANPPPPGDPPGATHFAPYSMTVAGTSLARPISSGTTICAGLDFFVEWGPSDYPPYGGSSFGDLDATLARWLRSDGDRYPGSALEAQAVSLGTISDGTAELLNRLSAEAGAMLNTLAYDLLFAGLDFYAWQEQNKVTIVDKLADLAESVGEFTGVSALEYLGKAARWFNGLDQAPYRDPATYYDPVDSTAFTDNLAWSVQADLYTVDVDTFDPAGTSEAFGSLVRYGYFGKWSILDVDHAAEWHYFNTPKARLESTGHTMPGLALILYRPGHGTVTAWKLKPEE